MSKFLSFRTVGQLNRDIAVWSDRLPRDLDLIVGVPRSGLLAATLLALHMHLPLTDVEGLLAGRMLGTGRRLDTGESPRMPIRRALVLDDSVDSGFEMRRVRERLASVSTPLIYGAVYSSPSTPAGVVDCSFDVVAHPRMFEWNILHHGYLENCCMDIDGVLCRNPLEEENDDGRNYLKFMAEVPPRLVPARKVGWLVTARLERYRKETEDWLEKAGVKYGELIMHPAATAQERQLKAGHGSFKAEAYRRTGAMLFIESDVMQAREIVTRSKQPVYCTDTREMLYPARFGGVGAAPRKLDEVVYSIRRIRHRLLGRATRGM